MELGCHSIDRVKLALDGKGVMKTNYHDSGFSEQGFYLSVQKTAINVKKGPKRTKNPKNN